MTKRLHTLKLNSEQPSLGCAVAYCVKWTTKSISAAVSSRRLIGLASLN